MLICLNCFFSPCPSSPAPPRRLLQPVLREHDLLHVELLVHRLLLLALVHLLLLGIASARFCTCCFAAPASSSSSAPPRQLLVELHDLLVERLGFFSIDADASPSVGFATGALDCPKSGSFWCARKSSGGVAAREAERLAPRPTRSRSLAAQITAWAQCSAPSPDRALVMIDADEEAPVTAARAAVVARPSPPPRRRALLGAPLLLRSERARPRRRDGAVAAAEPAPLARHPPAPPPPGRRQHVGPAPEPGRSHRACGRAAALMLVIDAFLPWWPFLVASYARCSRRAVVAHGPGARRRRREPRELRGDDGGGARRALRLEARRAAGGGAAQIRERQGAERPQAVLRQGVRGAPAGRVYALGVGRLGRPRRRPARGDPAGAAVGVRRGDAARRDAWLRVGGAALGLPEYGGAARALPRRRRPRRPRLQVLRDRGQQGGWAERPGGARLPPRRLATKPRLRVAFNMAAQYDYKAQWLTWVPFDHYWRDGKVWRCAQRRRRPGRPPPRSTRRGCGERASDPARPAGLAQEQGPRVHPLGPHVVAVDVLPALDGRHVHVGRRRLAGAPTPHRNASADELAALNALRRSLASGGRARGRASTASTSCAWRAPSSTPASRRLAATRPRARRPSAADGRCSTTSGASRASCPPRRRDVPAARGREERRRQAPTAP